MSRQLNYNLCHANHTSVQECCKLTKMIMCSLHKVLNSVVLNSRSADRECFNLMLVSTEWVYIWIFNLVMEAESAAETPCFIKIRNGNIPVFVTANNKTSSCIFRLENFLLRLFFCCGTGPDVLCTLFSSFKGPYYVRHQSSIKILVALSKLKVDC
jgi:hypothetical protein